VKSLEGVTMKKGTKPWGAIRKPKTAWVGQGVVGGGGMTGKVRAIYDLNKGKKKKKKRKEKNRRKGPISRIMLICGLETEV